MAASCTALAFLSPFYALGLTGMIALALACVFDAAMARKGLTRQVKPIRFLRYFLMMNLALFKGMIRFLRGGQNSVWEPTKRVVRNRRLTRKQASTKSVP
jgi:hypothetical protein